MQGVAPDSWRFFSLWCTGRSLGLTSHIILYSKRTILRRHLIYITSALRRWTSFLLASRRGALTTSSVTVSFTIQRIHTEPFSIYVGLLSLVGTLLSVYTTPTVA